ncbi:MAG: Bax inhibitor-1/YccA family protein, partial [Puniceicoccales bacterium]|nr:Bax inhibitor-1/YccA family protein [Puniceicoccales bacterium]
MGFRNSTNPAFRDGAFRTVVGSDAMGAMTAKGAYNKTGFLLALVIASAAFAWMFPYADVQALGSKIVIFLVAAVAL